MAVILAIHTKTALKLSYIDIIHCFEASLFTTTIGTQYDDYRNHTTIILQSMQGCARKYVNTMCRKIEKYKSLYVYFS